MDFYTVGKGILTLNGTDVGNCPEFSWRQELTILRQLRVVNGIRQLKAVHVTEAKAIVRFTLDEWTDYAVELARDGAEGLDAVLTQTQALGPKRKWTFPDLSVNPATEVSLINNNAWGVLSFEAEVVYREDGTFMDVENI